MTTRPQATAAYRTELLHRMLVLRRGGPAGGEAITVGMGCVLGPADTLADGPARAVRQARDDVLGHRTAVTVCFVGDDPGPSLGHAVDDRLPVLFCCADQHEHHPAGCEALPVHSVDSADVEAVVRAARTAVHPVRAGDGPRLLHFYTYGPQSGARHDPIRILAERMRTDHQLDDNAYAAIEKDAAATLGSTDAPAIDLRIRSDRPW